MPQQPNQPLLQTSTFSLTKTILLTLLLFIAFFPSLFHYIWTIPLSIIRGPFSDLPRTTPHHLYSSSPHDKMSWAQTQFALPARARGSYLITDTILKEVPQIKEFKVGLLNLFIQHTSCALSLNENWDEDVRADMSDALDRIAPEGKCRCVGP